MAFSSMLWQFLKSLGELFWGPTPGEDVSRDPVKGELERHLRYEGYLLAPLDENDNLVNVFDMLIMGEAEGHGISPKEVDVPDSFSDSFSDGFNRATSGKFLGMETPDYLIVDGTVVELRDIAAAIYFHVRDHSPETVFRFTNFQITLLHLYKAGFRGKILRTLNGVKAALESQRFVRYIEKQYHIEEEVNSFRSGFDAPKKL